jgi:hypothetical protein
MKGLQQVVYRITVVGITRAIPKSTSDWLVKKNTK